MVEGHIHMFLNIDMCVHVYKYMCTCVHMHMHMHMHIRMYSLHWTRAQSTAAENGGGLHIRVHKFRHVHIQIYIHTYTHTYIYICICTCIHAKIPYTEHLHNSQQRKMEEGRCQHQLWRIAATLNLAVRRRLLRRRYLSLLHSACLYYAQPIFTTFNLSLLHSIWLTQTPALLTPALLIFIFLCKRAL